MRRLTVAASTFNFSYRDIALQSPKWLAETVTQAGFDGLEWSDVPNIHPLSIAGGGLAVALAKQGAIYSLHQSWQATQYRELPHVFAEAKQAASDKTYPTARALAAAGFQGVIIAGLPRLERSLEKLEPIQNAVGHKLPVVVHPNEQHVGKRRSTPAIDYPAIRRSGRFGPIRFQPTAELLDAWGVLSRDPIRTVDDMLAVMPAKGFDEVAFDTNHAYDLRDGKQFSRPADMAAELTRRGAMAELQLSYRPDFGGKNGELQTFLTSNTTETPQGEVTAAVRENTAPHQSLYVVAEVRADTFDEETLRMLELPDYIAGLGLLTQRIRQEFSPLS